MYDVMYSVACMVVYVVVEERTEVFRCCLNVSSDCDAKVCASGIWKARELGGM